MKPGPLVLKLSTLALTAEEVELLAEVVGYRLHGEQGPLDDDEFKERLSLLLSKLEEAGA